MKKLGVVLIMVATVVIASSCVSMKRFNELKADAIRLDSQNSIKAENIDRLNGEIESLNNTLASERSRYQRNLESAQNNFDQMKSRYERLLRAAHRHNVLLGVFYGLYRSSIQGLIGNRFDE